MAELILMMMMIEIEVQVLGQQKNSKWDILFAILVLQVNEEWKTMRNTF